MAIYFNGKPTTPTGTESFICYQNSLYCLVLNAGDQPLELSELDLTVKNCMVYSETIKITPEILSFSGTSLGLFCSTLEIAATLTIDVSGSSGADRPDVVVGTGDRGNDGTPGGSVWIYVEHMTDDLVNAIKVQADGGDGGLGGNTSDTTSGVAGGVGGSGGKGGSAYVYYGNVASSLLQTVRSSQTLAWPSQITAVGLVLAGCEPPAIPLSWVSTELIQKSATQFKTYQNLASSLSASVTALILVSNPEPNANPYPLSTTSSIALACTANIEKLLAMVTAPQLTDEPMLLSLSDAVTLSVTTWSQKEGSEATMVSAMEALTKFTATLTIGSDLYDLWYGIAEPLASMLTDWDPTIKNSMLSAQGGAPGHGGDGATAQNPQGQPGSAGAAGTTSSLLLKFDGLAPDTSITQVCASPDQCQMLLDVADALYFTNNPTDVANAASLYTTLTQRLAFVPCLLADASKTPVITSPLQEAYNDMEMNQLSYSSVSSLQLVYEKAKTSLNRINLQQDLFGHSTNWAPRLSVAFYEKDLTPLLSNLSTIEASITDYFSAIQIENDEDYIGKFQAASAAYQKNADQIAFIIGPNGILRTAANIISTLTPKLTKSRLDIEEAVIPIEADIRKHINLDPKLILEAFASVGTATTPTAAAAKGAAAAVMAGYTAWTTVDNIDGSPVDKTLIISQLETCDNTLQSLSEAYSIRDDGHVSIDDPGALKVVTAADALEAMVNQYKGAITGADADTLKAALDAYIMIITTRNNAVISYNAGLQLLHEAYISEQHDKVQMSVLGQAILTADPYLPAIYKWLMKTQNDTRYQIMQRLNYAARALRFWGLYPTFEFAEPGPLLDWTQLNQNWLTLTSVFDSFTENYAQTPWITWPAPETAGSQGLIVELDPASIDSLLTVGLDGKYELYWTINQSDANFKGKFNIRLSQLRVWIIGAAVTADPAGRQELTVDIQHCGNETVVSPAAQSYPFVHDAVQFQFIYDVSKVKSIDDCTSSVIFSQEFIDGDDYTGQQSDLADAVAPVGPFTMWHFAVDPNNNNGLVMERGKVSHVYIEFCGRSMAHTPSFANGSKNPERWETWLMNTRLGSTP